MNERTYHDMKEEQELCQSLIHDNPVKLANEIIEKNRQLDKYEKELCELQEYQEWYYKLQEENQQSKQALNEIREYIKDKQKIQYKFALSHIECDDILKIIDKSLNLDKVRGE